MSSQSLQNWQNDRIRRLDLTESHCVALTSSQPTRPSGLEVESVQAYVLLLSGHFQGFCRDLYTECSQAFAGAVPRSMLLSVQSQFGAKVALNLSNPTYENIRQDFERFGISLALQASHPQWLTDLGHLNYWRNHVAHQKSSPPPTGVVPQVLSLCDVQRWRASCDGLATALDRIMEVKLAGILGNAPW